MKHQDMLGEMLDSAADRLAAYGYLLTGSQHSGEDLVQDAIVKVFVRRRRLDDPRAAEAYVRAAMRTLHIDRMRRDDALTGAHARLVDHRQAARRDGSDRRPRPHRPAPSRPSGSKNGPSSSCSFYDDLKVSDIATQMRLADGTVKRYLSNALDKLAGELGSIDDSTERIGLVERKK